ncbi:MAG: hypothetical protein KC613_17635 [Myxococcales bacterium]|nr:hypothetical protein [Myxococcales bacterium]MCB9525819.1 knotted carbamoyltransferase YgeW [Myxococcales bacterium]
MTGDRLDPQAVAALLGRSLLKTPDYDDAALDALIGAAEAFARLDKAGVKTPFLPHELAYAVFFDNSTRTKSAWAGAAARLGMQPVIVDGSSTQVAHGETAEETGAMLGMNAHAMGIRHDLILGEGRAFLKDLKKGIDDYLGATEDPRQVPIVNLQCDLDHPTQSLADLLFLREKFGDVRGKKITVSWAYSPSYAKPLSVPQGLIMLLSRFGADLTLAHPEGYPLLDEALDVARTQSAASGGSFTVTHDMDAAFQGAHVVYPKSWGPLDMMWERVQHKDKLAQIEARMLAQNAQHKDWICDERRMALTADAQYMHCLPADIGDEVAHSVLDRFRVDLAREANKKVYVIMAMLATAKVPGLAEKLNKALEGLK